MFQCVEFRENERNLTRENEDIAKKGKTSENTSINKTKRKL